MSFTCRSCLIRNSNEEYLSLRSVFSEFVNKSILDLLNIVTSSNIKHSESFAQSICMTCFKNLNIAYNFIVLFNNSQEVLQKAQTFSDCVSTNIQSGHDCEIVREENIKEIGNSVDSEERNVILNDDGSTYEDMVKAIFGEETKDRQEYIQGSAENITPKSTNKTPKTILVSVEDVLKDKLIQKSLKLFDANLSSHEDIEISHQQLQNEVILSKNDEVTSQNDNEVYFNEDHEVFYTEQGEASGHSNEAQYVEFNNDLDVNAIFKMETNRERNMSNIQLVTIDDVLNSTIKFKDDTIRVMSVEDVLKVKPRPRKNKAQNLGILQCNICSATFNKRKSLNAHQSRTHNPDWKETFKCHICEISSKTFGSFNRHMLKHKGHWYSCNQCDQKYLARSKLKDHVLKIHENKYKYLCTQCGRGFKHLNALKYHMNKHTDSKNFVCRYCEFSFLAQSSLKRHERVHTGERPYECKWCKKTFAGAAEKQRHEFGHEGVYRFQCKYCHQKFVQVYNMKVHMTKHSGPYVCEVCPNNFADADILKFHYAHTHKIKDVIIEDEDVINEVL